MVPFASKALFALSAALYVAAFGYGVATSDSLGTTTLGFLATAALVLAIAVLVATPDAPPFVAADTPLAEQTPVGGRPAGPSLYPFGAAVGVGLLALGAATNGVVQLAALVVLVLVGAAWLVQHWTEDPAYNAVFGARVRDRFVLPFTLPLGVVLLVAILAISLSRVFLALPEQGTRAVALAIAIVIVVSAFVIAASSRMARTALALLTGFALVAVVAAGIVGIAHGERKFERPKPAAKTFVPQPGQAPPATSTTTTAP